jgi:hypothetical protein
MPYTLWSRGRLLGESELQAMQSFEHVMFGWFLPTSDGERTLDVLTGGRVALHKLNRMLRNPMREMMRPKDRPKGQWPEDIRRTTAYADYVALEDEVAAMHLELRGPDGKAIDCEDITVQDTEFTMALADRGRRRAKPAVAERAPPGQRYQMQVHLRR